ncbi:3-oxoacyl-ACP reductase FabG [Bacillus timonensis]|uniref:3-oxoacyl-ACP reductase FabG n=1 Tax=Bacillus timonensis TaxID=1033734 RepID=UPI000287E5B7|nr:3-oxoacyl-ACP reductase FabG [Bacillus timonensis]
MTFTDKVVIVTGGSKGIGKSTAESFATQGAVVHIVDIDSNALNETLDELTAKDLQIFIHKADVSKKEEIDALFEEVHAKHGHIDILVNNAGVIRDNLFFKMTTGDWDLVMDVHLKGAFYCSQAAQKYMVQQNAGRIINISSTSALGNRGQANYATAKAGIQGFTKTLAIELGRFGITVNAVAPGFIETDMTRATAARINMDFDEFIQSRVELIPVRRSGKPEDIANAVMFFADDKASFVNGQILYVAGGPKA